MFGASSQLRPARELRAFDQAVGYLDNTLTIRPPGGSDGTVVAALVESIDLAATIREVADVPPPAGSEARSLMGHMTCTDVVARDVSVTENWGLACFDANERKRVVDEDTLVPVQLFDRFEDPTEDVNLVADNDAENVVGQLTDAHVRPFLATLARRPHHFMFAVERLRR